MELPTVPNVSGNPSLLCFKVNETMWIWLGRLKDAKNAGAKSIQYFGIFSWQWSSFMVSFPWAFPWEICFGNKHQKTSLFWLGLYKWTPILMTGPVKVLHDLGVREGQSEERNTSSLAASCQQLCAGRGIPLQLEPWLTLGRAIKPSSEYYTDASAFVGLLHCSPQAERVIV